jgi:hypothetical protein
MSSSLSGNQFGAGFGAWLQSDIPAALGVVNPGMFWLIDGGITYWNSDLSINTGSLANLVNNYYKANPLGLKNFIFGVDFDLNTGGGTGTFVSAAQFGTAMGNLANYLINFTQPNGQKFPLLGMGAWNEPNAPIVGGEGNAANYWNQMATKVKAVNPNLLIFGPQTAGLTWLDFPTQVPQLDVFCWDTFTGGNQTDPFDTSPYNNAAANQYIGDAQTVTNSITRKTKGVGTVAFGYVGDANFEACSSENSYIGAVFTASVCLWNLNNSNVPCWGGHWGGWGNGAYGVITDKQSSSVYGWVTGRTLVTPKGYVLGKAVRTIYGPRWNVTTNSGMLTCATTPAAGKLGLMVVNRGQGARSGQVALSHWPVNTTGNGTANVWQINSSHTLPGTDGIVSTVAVTNGLTASISFPDPSVTIISV